MVKNGLNIERGWFFSRVILAQKCRRVFDWKALNIKVFLQVQDNRKLESESHAAVLACVPQYIAQIHTNWFGRETHDKFLKIRLKCKF